MKKYTHYFGTTKINFSIRRFSYRKTLKSWTSFSVRRYTEKNTYTKNRFKIFDIDTRRHKKVNRKLFTRCNFPFIYFSYFFSVHHKRVRMSGAFLSETFSIVSKFPSIVLYARLCHLSVSCSSGFWKTKK